MSKKIFVSDFDETQNLNLTSKTRVFDVFKLKLMNFQINLVGMGAAGHTSR